MENTCDEHKAEPDNCGNVFQFLKAEQHELKEVDAIIA